MIKADGVVKDAEFLFDVHEKAALEVSLNNMELCLGFLMDGTSANRKALKKLEVCGVGATQQS